MGKRTNLTAQQRKQGHVLRVARLEEVQVVHTALDHYIYEPNIVHY